jgi:hypothetical protein
MHELVEIFTRGSGWMAQLAAELGYFDKAHLIDDFRSSGKKYTTRAQGF